MNPDPTDQPTRRKFIDVRPKLDFTALEPGKAATEAIRRAAADLKLHQRIWRAGALTGPVPMADEEFATVQEGMLCSTASRTVLIVLGILWLALKSAQA